MNEQFQAFAGIVIAACLALDGFLHAYWATGGNWPVHDRRSLVQAILNSNNLRAFRPVILFPLAALLICGASLVVARAYHFTMAGQPIFDTVLQIAMLGIAIGLLMRTIMGIGWALGLAPSKSKLFYQLNLLVYTPVCLILFIAAVVIVAS